MHRICHCLTVLVFVAATAAAPVLARDIQHSGPNSGSCPETSRLAQDKSEPTPDTTPATVPERETRARPSVHGDAPSNGRPSPRRWHSFLPGMVR
ncbi:hypothetical protein [Marilutibacter alkalisoli]|uniref:Secreted protein n=1 Tax=Marilutibacter alkalisoli TaxID=2591633 RepID=A0A514BUX7_9GAMM|nr:hypothetical protein [Lysobacter alkalisoli]QDH71115.1 hypothetical protein FKV23_14220 [Lysobacter alkalisoli]